VISSSDLCSSAIAYLKAEGGPGPALELRPPNEPILRSLGNGLLTAYAVDGGETFYLVQRRHLSEVGLTESELHKRALTNLYNLARKRLEVRPYQGIYVVLMGGNFEASLLLVDSLWDESLWLIWRPTALPRPLQPATCWHFVMRAHRQELPNSAL